MIKVYIVDDSVLFVSELALTVPWERLGVQVIGSAYDADTAEREIRELQPDLVITDIAMPRRDGLNLIESLADMPGMEFILISAFPRFEYALKAIKLKTADYFVKPFDDEEFYQAVDRVAKRIVARQQNRAEEELPISAPELSRIQNSHLTRAVQYLDAHYSEELSAAQVAKALFISESYLSKLFRRDLNTSFVEYLNYLRIRKAMHLLKTTDMKIYEISDRVGFCDHRYFATLFRKYVGISPSQYKSSLKGPCP